MLQQRLNELFRPVDASSLAYFRIGFGLILFWECWRYFDLYWIEDLYMDPAWHLPYPFFGWVTPWPGWGMYAHFGALAVSSLLVALGLFYRLSALLVFLSFSYLFLLDETRYLNHFYLVCLIGFCLIFVPSQRCFSLDARWRPALRSQTVPYWSVQLLRFTVGLPYFFGGVAKLNADWLVGAQPMGMWLAERDDLPLIGPLMLDPVWSMPLAFVFSYGGLLIDLLAVPLLVWSRTRPFTLAVLFAFHCLNSVLFDIGIFPWFMIWATPIFCAPDWPRRLAGFLRLRGQSLQTSPGWVVVTLVGVAFGIVASAARYEWAVVPFAGSFVLGALVSWTLQDRLSRRVPGHSRVTAAFAPERPFQSLRTPSVANSHRLILSALLLWATFHVLFPLRHLLIPGNVNWTEEGHRYAWHMKLRDKQADLRLYARDPASGQLWEVDARPLLSERQYERMSKRPFMIRQFAHYVRDHLAAQGHGELAIHAEAWVSLNGRDPQLMVNPDVDLAAEPPARWRADWILPLTTPLPDPPRYLARAGSEETQ